jgi:hypothetical protein
MLEKDGANDLGDGDHIPRLDFFRLVNAIALYPRPVGAVEEMEEQGIDPVYKYWSYEC